MRAVVASKASFHFSIGINRGPLSSTCARRAATLLRSITAIPEPVVKVMLYWMGPAYASGAKIDEQAVKIPNAARNGCMSVRVPVFMAIGAVQPHKVTFSINRLRYGER